MQKECAATFTLFTWVDLFTPVGPVSVLTTKTGTSQDQEKDDGQARPRTVAV